MTPTEQPRSVISAIPAEFAPSWKALGVHALAVCRSKGFLAEPLTVEGEIAQLMLVVTELAEAVEGLRKHLMDDKVPSRRAVEVELADALLRIAIIGEAQGYDLAGAVIDKDAYNQTRPWRHGGKAL